MRAIRTASAVALVAVVATGASAGAAALISGSQLRDHTVPLSKMTRGAISALHGHNGARGRTGAQGAPGIAQVALIQGTAAAQCAGGGGACQVATSTAVCPRGSRAISGGYAASPIDNIVEMSLPGLNAAGNSVWNVLAVNEGSLAGDVTAWATCASGPRIAASADTARADSASFQAQAERLRAQASAHR